MSTEPEKISKSKKRRLRKQKAAFHKAQAQDRRNFGRQSQADFYADWNGTQGLGLDPSFDEYLFYK